MAGFFIPLVSITLSGLPGNRIPAASGLSNFVRIMCGGIGTSIFHDRVGSPHDHCITRNWPSRRTRTTRCSISRCSRWARAGFSQPQAYGLFNTMATQQAAQLGRERSVLCIGRHLRRADRADLDHEAGTRGRRCGCGSCGGALRFWFVVPRRGLYDIVKRRDRW